MFPKQAAAMNLGEIEIADKHRFHRNPSDLRVIGKGGIFATRAGKALVANNFTRLRVG